MNDSTPITNDRETLTGTATNSTPVYVQPANDPAKASSQPAPSGNAAPPELDSKMVGGGEELRDHDFPTPNQNSIAASFPRVNDEVEKPQAHEVRSGGQHGELPGDEQKLGQTPSIMDQEMLEPQDIGTGASDVTPFN